MRIAAITFTHTKCHISEPMSAAISAMQGYACVEAAIMQVNRNDDDFICCTRPREC